jgi:PTH1 family peptidyl-tRNA hydrolase
MTFINDSGTAVKNFIKNKNITPSQIIVAYDDLDLAAGKIRLKFAGGSGGHNGIKDIIEKIGTKDFWRLKIGIGKPAYKDDVISYVLGKPSPNDKKDIAFGIESIIQNSRDLLDGSYAKFMNNLNGDNDGI